MNVFKLRDRLVKEYERYTRSFITIRDKRVHEVVEQELGRGLLWPEPIVQLNPSFQPGESIDELVNQGVLHPECRHIFRSKSADDPTGRPLRLHRHQADAVKLARTGASYVLTTGTGSGKSLAYLIPIVDRVLREGPGKGIRAIVVYPMNALANSQDKELEKFLSLGNPDGRGRVRYRRYTGQESDAERQEIVANPPDILLTNYVMLELILTRPRERGLVRAAQGLRFLVLDELHTYRGRQGADVALLARRVREACDAQALQCVGTSATLAGARTVAEQQAEVASVASRIFGAHVSPDAVIVETLQRATAPYDPDDRAFVAALRARVADPKARPPADVDGFTQDPLARWIESTLGLATEPGSGRLVRAQPLPVRGPDGAARKLADLTGVDEARCAEAIEETLLAGYALKHPETGFPLFAFRLHQFFSRGETVYASPEPEGKRYITTHAQQFVPGDRSRVLLPLAFCRECGQDYYTVRRRKENGCLLFEPRDLLDIEPEEGTQVGYLYQSSEEPWPADLDKQLERLPDDWLEQRGGKPEIKRDRKGAMPEAVRVGPDGREQAAGAEFQFIPAPFRFCLRCGVSYVTRERRDFSKLSTLGSGGRASATTILVSEAVRSLREDRTLPAHARKVLSFTDNRQDASLQAGHFNDFIELGLLRSALYRAVSQAGPEGIPHEELTQRVFAALGLPLERYARDPEVRFQARAETDRALRDVLGYRLYRDLERGWRVAAPNLEQCGLLEIAYASLEELCEAQDVWEGCHPALATAAPHVRQAVAKVLLDFMRRALAIDVDYLSGPYQEQLKQRSNQHLIPPWAIDEEEKLIQAAVAYPRSRRVQAREFGGNLFISPRSGFGRFLRRQSTFPTLRYRLKEKDVEEVIRDLLEALRVGGQVVRVAEAAGADDVPGYQVAAASMRWRVGDGSHPLHDPIRLANLPEEGQRSNEFFTDFYKNAAAYGVGLEGREHTAQVPPPEREEREQRFRDGRLPVLFCSPTMELGVDIAELNVVNLRNVPPTPANYAQRSGRAGRSGQPALVFTYCSTGSSHDQYFFRRPQRMVAGSVSPPQIDLANEDLVRAHVHAVWLAESGKDLHSSMAEVLQVEGDQPSLEVRQELRKALADRRIRERARQRCQRILATIPELKADWYHPGWLDSVLDGVERAFDQACERWRGLYRAALEARDLQDSIVRDPSRTPEDRAKAKRLRAEAESQLELLRADSYGERPYQSDFYSYRYLASEGFLPGYSFPRLPISAYVPGRRGAAGRDEFLSRPRFLAISEFGPRAIVYHEGSRYVINRVLLPADLMSERGLVTSAAKHCQHCGYVHPMEGGGPGPDLCQRCGRELTAALERLFRLQNVSTQRRDRISSDEEERLRQGFEIRTGVRFVEENGTPRAQAARAVLDSQPLAELTYSAAATIWRVNVGWKRRARPDQLGFLLDTERGYWERKQDEDDPEDPMSPAKQRVIPYVEDRRNTLLFTPAAPLAREQMASLGAALKRAIQLTYQLEEQELAVEPLPGQRNRRLLLLYESAEGGAGVLRRLVSEPEALARVARQALELCHFDPDTGEDRRRAPGAQEDCEAACYDCLMSYANQPDHLLLDRHTIRDELLHLAQALVETSPGPLGRDEHVARLLRQCDSELERRFLRFLDAHRLELPSRAQALLEACRARPDFLYEREQAAVFVDGPVHDNPDVAARDEQAAERLEDAGWTVIRFPYDEAAWPGVVRQWPNVFGRLP